MKKIFMSILSFVIILTYFSCTHNTYESVKSKIERYDFDFQEYNQTQISDIEENILSAGIEMEGKVLNITHFIKYDSTNDKISEWIYLYEFENESDALKFKENREAYFTAKIQNNIVLFGNSEVLNEIDF